MNKKIIMTLGGLALVVSSFSSNYLGIKTKIDFKQKNKRLHAAMSGVMVPIFDLFYLRATPKESKSNRMMLAYFSSLGVGFGKEVYDEYIGKTGWSDHDMGANICGATTGLLVTPVIDELWKYICDKYLDGGKK